MDCEEGILSRLWRSSLTAMVGGAASHGLQVVSGVCWILLATVLWSCSTMQLVGATEGLPPEKCKRGSGCTLNNAYRLWNDRSSCKAAKVVYPKTEQEILDAVADAARNKQKAKVATTYGHSIPKGACPGTDVGVIISSRDYNSIVSVDRVGLTVTAQSGITMRAFFDGIAAQDLALTVAPFFDGVTLGGVIANSVHGSTLWGKGGAVHEYVVGMRIVTPATPEENYAKVRVLASGDPDLNAAKVNLGVLGVVSTITLQVEPMFKRKLIMELVMGDDGLTGAKALEFATSNQYGEILWYPGLKQVVYKHDNRVPVNTPGDGRNNYLGLQAQPAIVFTSTRLSEEIADAAKSREQKCVLALGQVSAQQRTGYGYEKMSTPQGIPNPNLAPEIGLLNAFPVVGKQNFMATAGGCQRSQVPLFFCAWDPQIKGIVYYDGGAALPLRDLGAFIEDVKRLRAKAPTGSLCDMDLYTGILIRFVKETQAYMGTGQEDAAMLDFAWSRGDDFKSPRLDMDVFQEIEQLAFDKYGARPHWGKNRNHVFDGVHKKYVNLDKFLATKDRFDPDGVFSSEWSDAILGIKTSGVFTNVPYCAVEGNCKCATDQDCSETGQLKCAQGLIYTEAKVCRSVV